MVTFANVDSVRLPSLKFVGLLKHRITRKLLKTDRYILQGVWQALNRLFIYGTFSVIATGASLGQTKNEGRGT